jgi:HSP20 family protein
MMRYYIAPVNQLPQWSVASLPRRIQALRTSDEFRFIPVDILEKQDEFILSALTPGLKAEDISISLEKDVITIEGSLAYAREEEGNYLVTERPSGNFKRSFKLPSPIDTEKIEARLSDGILIVEFPKSEKALPRMIKVN